MSTRSDRFLEEFGADAAGKCSIQPGDVLTVKSVKLVDRCFGFGILSPSLYVEDKHGACQYVDVDEIWFDPEDNADATVDALVNLLGITAEEALARLKRARLIDDVGATTESTA